MRASPPSPTTSLTISPPSRPRACAPRPSRRITHITEGAGTEDRLYGPLGEIVQETRAIPIQGGQVPTYTTKYQFDTWNRIQQITYPDQPTGEAVKYFYDSGGLVNRVHGNDDQLETDYASNITYDKFGQRLSMTNGNGVITTYAYRPDNRRLANVQATLPVGYTFNNFNFSYDAVGNLTALQNTAQFPGSFTGGNLGNAIGGPWTKTFAYDDLYRLTTSTGTHSTSSIQTFNYSFSQAYDSIHNITHKTQSATVNAAVNPQISYDFAYSTRPRHRRIPTGPPRSAPSPSATTPTATRSGRSAPAPATKASTCSMRRTGCRAPTRDRRRQVRRATPRARPSSSTTMPACARSRLPPAPPSIPTSTTPTSGAAPATSSSTSSSAQSAS
jgi:hypothetical protein